MTRIQIQLTEAQSRVLKLLSIEDNVSIAELIQHSIDQFLQQHQQPSQAELKERALSVVGKYASGRSDISSNHDDHLADIYAGVGE